MVVYAYQGLVTGTTVINAPGRGHVDEWGPLGMCRVVVSFMTRTSWNSKASWLCIRELRKGDGASRSVGVVWEDG